MIVFLLLSITFTSVNSEVFFQPEQIHLSYGDDPASMIVTWVTQSQVNDSFCKYGLNAPNQLVKGEQNTFTDGGSEHRSFYIHKVVLNKLKPGKKYYYRVGSLLGWSSLYWFTAMKTGANWSPTFAVYGDMGNYNGQSIAQLQEEAQDGLLDAILHVGDFAYDLHTDNARVGDAFMNQVQEIAAYIPYMTTVGNHEAEYNFSNYKNRFSMPGDTQNMFYSIDIGPVHFVMFSSEFYYFPQYGWLQIANQYEWLQKDLQKANENRDKRPWIITMCHRPMYCSNSNDAEHCPNKYNIIRLGIPLLHAYGVEELLYKYGVDVHFQAHEHSYERMWPVFNLTVCNGTNGDPYRNPRAPVHIVTGSAGCQEGVDPFEKIPHPWSALRSDDYGFTRMKVFNSTHLYMEQTSDNLGGKVIDSIMVVKDKHGMGLYDCHVDTMKFGQMLDGFKFYDDHQRHEYKLKHLK